MIRRTPNESLEHHKRKYFLFEVYHNKGYTVTFDKRLPHNTIKNKSMIVDLFAENETEIICIEVIHTCDTGKDPRDYITTDKEITFIKDHEIMKGYPRSRSNDLRIGISIKETDIIYHKLKLLMDNEIIQQSKTNTNELTPTELSLRQLVIRGINIVLEFYNHYGFFPLPDPWKSPEMEEFLLKFTNKEFKKQSEGEWIRRDPDGWIEEHNRDREPLPPLEIERRV